MRTIVIPTDFSDTADNAAQFGVALAQKLGANVTFFHAYNFPNADPFKPVFSSSGSAIEPQELANEYKTAIEAQLQDMCRQYAAHTGGDIEFDSFSAAGMTVDRVVDTMELVEGSFVVMGTKGYSDRKEILLGSNAARMVEHSPVPVMVIPKDATYKPLDSILFASSLLEKDMDPLELLIPIAEAYKAQLHLIHLDEEADTEDEKDAMEGYKEIVHDRISYARLHFHLMKESDVIEGINQAAEKREAKLIVMNTLRKQGVAGWFKRSLSKEMVFHTHLPLLVFQS